MIIFDYSQIAIANIIGGIENELDENYIRHMVLNTIRGYIKRFKKTYGTDVVLACDGKEYWRTDIFPHYKACRSKMRKESKYDWGFIFQVMATIRDELKEWSPFHVIHLSNCEGDDIIYTLASRAGVHEKVLVVSTDKDFVFLHGNSNIKQFSPMKKKFITYKDPKKAALELIIRGDRDDGIPNILSPDDTFVQGIRQKSIMKNKLELWLTQQPEEFCDSTTITNYERNKKLIDLTMIPDSIQDSIIREYQSIETSGASRFIKYLASKKAKILFQQVGDFF